MIKASQTGAGLVGWWHWNRKGAKVGDTVLKFQCDGCMAQDHNFQWVGQIEAFEAYADLMAGYHYAVVRIIKRGHADWRDQDLGEERLVVEGGGFCRLGGHLFGYFT